MRQPLLSVPGSPEHPRAGTAQKKSSEISRGLSIRLEIPYQASLFAGILVGGNMLR